jgi:hypothetical protein
MNSDDVEGRTERTAAAVEADGSQADDYQAGRAYRGPRPAASIYAAALRWIALSGVAAGFGASALSLAILGLGVPFFLAALLAGLWSGFLIYAIARWALAAAGKDQPGA